MRRTGSPPPGKPTALAALGLGHPGWRGWRTRGADCRGDEVLARLSAVGGVVLLADTTLTPTQANIGDRKQGRICSFTGISEHQRTTTISCIRFHAAEVAGSIPASPT